jgi:hypothetical protein
MITTEERMIILKMLSKENETDTKIKKISARELRREKLKMRAIVDANELKRQQLKKNCKKSLQKVS